MKARPSQDDFVAARSREWNELDALVGTGDALHQKDGPAISRAAALYRSLCTDLMRCRAARYTPDLTSYLDALAGRTHATLYGAQPLRVPGLVGFVRRDFPRALRANWRLFAIACALFFVPFVVGLAGALGEERFAESVLPSSTLQSMAMTFGSGIGVDPAFLAKVISGGTVVGAALAPA